MVQVGHLYSDQVVDPFISVQALVQDQRTSDLYVSKCTSVTCSSMQALGWVWVGVEFSLGFLKFSNCVFTVFTVFSHVFHPPIKESSQLDLVVKNGGPVRVYPE